MNKLATAVVAVVLSTPSLVRAQEAPPPPPPAPPPPAAEPPPSMFERPPSTGLGYLITGGVFTGLGAVNLLTAPICNNLTSLGSSGEKACVDASLIAGGVFLATAIPLLIVGGVKRSAYNEWKANHPAAAGLGVSVTASGGTLRWSAAF